MADETIVDRIADATSEQTVNSLGGMLDGLTSKDNKQPQENNELTDLYKALPESIKEVVDHVIAIDNDMTELVPRISGAATSPKDDTSLLKDIPDFAGLPAAYIGAHIDTVFGKDGSFFDGLNTLLSALFATIPQPVDNNLNDKNEETGGISKQTDIDARLAAPPKPDKEVDTKEIATTAKASAPDKKDLGDDAEKFEKKKRRRSGFRDIVDTAEHLANAKINPAKAMLNLVQVKLLMNAIALIGINITKKEADFNALGGKVLTNAFNNLNKIVLLGMALGMPKTLLQLAIAKKGLILVESFIHRVARIEITDDEISSLGSLAIGTKYIRNALGSILLSVLAASLITAPAILGLVGVKMATLFVNASRGLANIVWHKKDSNNLDSVTGGMLSLTKALVPATLAATLATVGGPMFLTGAVGILAMSLFIKATSSLHAVSVKGLLALPIITLFGLAAVPAFASMAAAGVIATIAAPFVVGGTIGALGSMFFASATLLAGNVAFKAIGPAIGLALFGAAAFFSYLAVDKALDPADRVATKAKKLFLGKGESEGFAQGAGFMGLAKGAINGILGAMAFASGLVLFELVTGLTGVLGFLCTIPTMGLVLFANTASMAYSSLHPAIDEAVACFESVDRIFSNTALQIADTGIPGLDFVGDIIQGVTGPVVGFIQGCGRIAGLGILIIMSAVLGALATVCAPAIGGLAAVGPAMETGYGGLAAGINYVGDALEASGKAMSRMKNAKVDVDDGLFADAASFLMGDSFGAFKNLAAIFHASAKLGKSMDNKSLTNIKRLAETGEALKTGFSPLADALSAIETLSTGSVSGISINAINDSLGKLAELDGEGIKDNMQIIAEGVNDLGEALNSLNESKIESFEKLAGAFSATQNRENYSAAKGGGDFAISSSKETTPEDDIKAELMELKEKVNGMNTMFEQMIELLTNISENTKPATESWAGGN